MKSKKMNDDSNTVLTPKRTCIKNSNQNSNIKNIQNSYLSHFNNDSTNELTIKKSNLKNLICSPDKKSKLDISEFYAEKTSQRKFSFEKEKNYIKRFKTNFIPYIGDDINLKEGASKNFNVCQPCEHSKEEIKLLYKTKSDSCTYDKQFGGFYGFFATTFKNFKKDNEDKIRISINNPIVIDKKTPQKKTSNKKTDTSTPNNGFQYEDESPFSSSRLYEDFDENTIHFFGLYDGHRGDCTSKYLKDTLHNTIFEKMHLLLSNPFSLITNSFSKIDNFLLNQCESKFLNFQPYDKSGSCAHIVISFNNKIFIANCGDSRSIISVNFGKTISQLSIDHKPNLQSEKKRIELSKGKIIQNNETMNIPRVIPGGLNVSRTIGDFQIKSPLTGGKKGMIISTPDIIEIDIKNEIDFIFIACDGIYDKLSNKEITEIIFSSVKRCITADVPYRKILQIIGYNIISNAIDKGSRDNLSLILLVMNNLYECIADKDVERINKALLDMKVSINRCDMLYPFWVNYQGEDSSFLHYVSEENKEKKKKETQGKTNKRKFSFWKFLGKCTCK